MDSFARKTTAGLIRRVPASERFCPSHENDEFSRFGLASVSADDWPIVEFDRGDHSEREESEQDHELGDLEWRIVLRRRDFLQRGNFLEQLHDEHKYVEVKSEHRADDVTFAPSASELADVARVNRNRQRDKRDDAGNQSGRNAVNGKEEP